MPETDIDSAVVSEITNTTTDFYVDNKSTEAASGEKETRFRQENWSKYYGYYRTIPELAIAIDTRATWTIGKGYNASPNTDFILTTIKGHNGGLKLGRAADTIARKDIVEGIDGLYAMDKCVMGFEKCDDHYPCPLHETWSEIKKKIIDSILSKSISELGSGMKLLLEKKEEKNIFF